MLQSLDVLGLITVPEQLENFAIEQVKYKNKPEQQTASSSNTEENPEISFVVSESELSQNNDKSNLDNQLHKNILESESGTDSEHNDTMADQTVPEFMELATPLLNYKYDGEPLKLKSFIEDVKLIEPLATSLVSKEYCFKFVKSKLEIEAAEILPDDCTTVEALIKCLEDNIKPEPAKS